MICEKPLVINPWNLDQLAVIEAESEGRIYMVLQLRVHPTLLALKSKLEQDSTGHKHDVVLTYRIRTTPLTTKDDFIPPLLMG